MLLAKMLKTMLFFLAAYGGIESIHFAVPYRPTNVGLHKHIDFMLQFPSTMQHQKFAKYIFVKICHQKLANFIFRDFQFPPMELS
jgi:hypothetical protein